MAGAENRAAGIVTHAVSIAAAEMAVGEMAMAAPAWAMAETTAAVGFDSNLCPGLHGVAWRLARPWSDSFRNALCSAAAETRAACSKT